MKRLLSISLVVLAACGGDSSPAQIDAGPTTVPDPIPVALAGSASCEIDGDCDRGASCFQGACAVECTSADHCLTGELCSPRGRCVPEDRAEDVNSHVSVIPGLSLSRVPSRIQYIAPGQTHITLGFTVDGDVPDDGLAWRTERSDPVPGAGNIRRTQGTGTYNLVIPTGDAGANANAELVRVNIVTTAGAVRLELVPELPHAGSYAGIATLNLFGASGLPIELAIDTSPEGSRLEDADSAWLILGVAESNLFSPISPKAASIDAITAPLQYDDFVGQWVATFENAYVVPADGVLGFASNLPVARSLRFEFELAGGGVLTGRMSDRWTGLSQTRSEAGATVVTDLTADGAIELVRVDGVPDLTNASVSQPPGAVPSKLPPPDFGHCDDAMVGAVSVAGPITVDGVSYGCETMSNLTQFDAALARKKISCGAAIAAYSMASGTIAEQIANHVSPDANNPPTQSFAEFMTECAQGDACVPAPEILCSRALLAAGIRASTNEIATNDGVRMYRKVAGEAFLGRQFAAFDNDTRTRLTWLETQDYPAIATHAVKSLVAGLLDDWRAAVLDVHLDVLADHLDEIGLTVLSQQVGIDATSDKQNLLLEVTQSWRGAMDALAMASARWNTLLDSPQERTATAAYVTSAAFQLYLSGLVLGDLNLAADAGANNASLGGGFASLLKQLHKLKLPFSQLIYERQGEVVVSTSLDPASGNETILADLEQKALTDLQVAQTAVTDVIAEAQARALDSQLLENQMGNDIDALRNELVELCGLPVGCALADYGAVAECEVQVNPGRCGFGWDGASDGIVEDVSMLAVSEAGSAIMEIRQAVLGGEAAAETLRAHVETTDLYATTTGEFAHTVESWRLARVNALTQMQSKFNEVQASNASALGAIEILQDGKLASYQQLLDDQQANIDNWGELTYGAITVHADEMAKAGLLIQAGEFLGEQGKTIKDVGDATAEGMPKSTGTSTDTTFLARMATKLAAISSADITKASGVALEATGGFLEATANTKKDLALATTRELELEIELRRDQAEADLAALEASIGNIEGARQSELDLLDDALALMQQQVAYTEAHERDMIELRDRRDGVKSMLIETYGLQIQQLQAELTMEQRVAEYLRVVQRAQLLRGRLGALENQRTNIGRIVGSPAVVFAWANRLGQAELRLESAKQQMMDWLVALEYFAVRPFMDQRIQILLANNTYQLEAIATKLRDIQSSCGGAINNQRVEISLRDDALRYTTATVDNANNGAVMSPIERFRAVLKAANVPVDKRIRYSTDATIGDLVRRGGILAMTFNLGIDNFANVANTCNAKLAGVSVQLVGEGLGSALPTVTVLYDGTSLLRSCQPDIATIAETLGPQATVFNEITEFKTPGRSISPVAMINTFEASQPNITLGGLPLVSQYTVLIDPTTGENAQIDWDALEDIRLQIDYTFQDLFPAGQCQ